MNSEIHIRNLGSSSSGNSTLVWSGNDALLVDMGFSQRYIGERFEEANVPFSSLKGVLITHLHGDHLTQAMLNKVLREDIPVFIHRKLRPVLLNRYKVKSAQQIHTFDGLSFGIGPFTVSGFEVPHDSHGGCFGYNLQFGNKKITIATDMGFPENGLAVKFKDSDLIIIESNHDPKMLETSGRPFELIERIKTIGHLSNKQCATFLDDILGRSTKNPQAIILAHLSDDCNLPRLAERGVKTLLKKRNLQETQVQVSKKNQPSDTITI